MSDAEKPLCTLHQLAAVWILAVVVDGALFFFLMVGWDAVPTEDKKNLMLNESIQVISTCPTAHPSTLILTRTTAYPDSKLFVHVHVGIQPAGPHCQGTLINFTYWHVSHSLR